MLGVPRHTTRYQESRDQDGSLPPTSLRCLRSDPGKAYGPHDARIAVGSEVTISGMGKSDARPPQPQRSVYYGWTIAGTLAVTEVTSWGVLYYAFAAFLVPMQQELGWSRTAVTGAYSLGLLVSGLVAPLVGRWVDRHGPRALMTLGSTAGTILLLVWASVGNLLAFYLVWVGMGFAMAATLYEPAFAVLAKWFERDRARALLLVTFAGGLASTIFLPLSAWLIGAQGWRGALLTLAAVLALFTIVPHALVLRRRPEDVGLLPDGVASSYPAQQETAPHQTNSRVSARACRSAQRCEVRPCGCSRRPSSWVRYPRRRLGCT